MRVHVDAHAAEPAIPAGFLSLRRLCAFVCTEAAGVQVSCNSRASAMGPILCRPEFLSSHTPPVAVCGVATSVTCSAKFPLTITTSPRATILSPTMRSTGADTCRSSSTTSPGQSASTSRKLISHVPNWSAASISTSAIAFCISGFDFPRSIHASRHLSPLLPECKAGFAHAPTAQLCGHCDGRQQPDVKQHAPDAQLGRARVAITEAPARLPGPEAPRTRCATLSRMGGRRSDKRERCRTAHRRPQPCMAAPAKRGRGSSCIATRRRCTVFSTTAGRQKLMSPLHPQQVHFETHAQMYVRRSTSDAEPFRPYRDCRKRKRETDCSPRRVQFTHDHLDHRDQNCVFYIGNVHGPHPSSSPARRAEARWQSCASGRSISSRADRAQRFQPEQTDVSRLRDARDKNSP